MIDRDKVISRLQIIRTWAEVGKTSGGIQGEKCLADVVNWIDDALELLKEQEPRVLTPEEIKRLPHGAVIWEECNEYDVLPLVACMVVRRNGFSPALLEEYGTMFADGLDMDEETNEILVRFWSARPTDEQMERVKWE